MICVQKLKDHSLIVNSTAVEMTEDRAPCLVINDFLGVERSAALLHQTVGNVGQFHPSDVGSRDRIVNHSTRLSAVASVSTLVASWFEQRLSELLPDIWSEFGLAPIAVHSYELELAVHSDGDYYRRHVDTFMGSGRTDTDRYVSCVYYFHRMPRQFDGGDLRLYPLPFGAGVERAPIVISPKHDSILLFPSWLPHEVSTVRIADNVWANARFSVNCWIHRTRRATSS